MNMTLNQQARGLRSKADIAVDAHVGVRMRNRRIQLGMSQEALADRIGVTFQQVQKYERGDNRIGASRLYAVACALAVPVSHFFEGLERSEPTEALPIYDRKVLEVAKTLAGIQDHELRQAILDLVRNMARCAGEPASEAVTHG